MGRTNPGDDTMSGRVLQVEGHLRVDIAREAQWELGAFGSRGEASGLEQGAWQAIGRAATVADALRRQGKWSLDGPATDFDTTEWSLRTEFDAPSQSAHRVVLGLDGLATLADVWLNDQVLLHSENMFVAHEIDVTHLLKPSENRLTLRFASLSEDLAQRRARPRWRVPMLRQQQLRWRRTTLLGRTPGWSPPAAAVGPWRGVWLECRNGLEVSGLRLRSGVHGSEGWLDIACRIVPLAMARVIKAEATLGRAGQSHAAPLDLRGDQCQGRAVVPEVALWWPHTHGEPCLYDLTLRLWLEGAQEPVQVEVGKVGFRTLHWHTDNGEFALSVNGVPVFCRGACWTPMDPVTLHGEPPAYADAVAQVRDAGMNMLRVAGMMVYEADTFYDACDAQGVLVWQDLMFANMDYPDDEAWRESVRHEVTQQLDRWQGRPAIALVCGNSEGEQQAAMWGAPRAQWSQALFDAELSALVAERLPDSAYWPSSAHGGAFPFQVDAGTASYYGVGAYLRPLADARLSRVRFASECLAFANIPEPAALARLPGAASKAHEPGWKARSPRDLGAGWDFDDVRDHYLRVLFGIDALALRYSDHERYLMLGRAVTGVAMAQAFAQWRSSDSECRGALVWFWRDLWAGAGWGLLDDAGEPKACWWMLRRTLQPLFLALTDEGLNGLYVRLGNESSRPVQVRLRVGIYRDGLTELMHAESQEVLHPASNTSRPLMNMFDGFFDFTHAYRFGPRGHDVVAVTLRDAQDRLIAQHVHWLDTAGLAAGTDLGLAASVQEHNGCAELTLTTVRAARGVHVHVPGWRPEDNYFDLLPGQQRVIQLHAISSPPRALGGQAMALNARAPTWVKVS
jgi:beta-mannosidase